ncbi:MAG: hypothetical protein KIS68_10945 [Bauldia sp.]|nr:hypothetical protein [Bauldia sp.]
MNPASVDAALAQATEFAMRVIETYQTQVAPGEVGPEGTATTSDEPIVANRAPTALLYGRVQSGKTAAMILSSALCLDNGFRIIVVLTSDSVALVEQTARRFKDLDGPRVFSTADHDPYEWEGQEDDLRKDIGRDGLVLVCAKDAAHLPRVIRFLQQVGAPLYPALILDDEADAATLDTTLAARTSGRANAPAFPSTIHRQVVENTLPGEEGESIREVFPHSVFVQVTATPFILFLQRASSPLRPNITFLLEPGVGYTGGETFFGAFDPNIAVPEPPIVFVHANEGQALSRPRVPAGLAASVAFFLVASAAQVLRDGGAWPRDGFKHLSHPSHRTNKHDVVANHIETYLADLRRQLRDDPHAARTALQDAYAELRRTVPNAPALDQILGVLPEATRQAEFFRVNAKTDRPQYGPRLNFLIGGNILGRGLTIDELLVTYYVREAQTSQMDTVWQHARMYGYRLTSLPYTRVYLPPQLARVFSQIHDSEEVLRGLLAREAEGNEVPIRVARGTRPTRPNATEPGVLRVISGTLAQLFPFFLHEDIASAGDLLRMLQASGVPTDEPSRDNRPTSVPLDQALAMTETVLVREDDPGRWHPAVCLAILESHAPQYQGGVTIYVRQLEQGVPPVRGWTRGRLSGEEISLLRARSPNTPAIALLHSGPPDAPTGWYPTLVLPANSATYVINPE